MKIQDVLSMCLFDLIAGVKGYTFKRVTSEQAHSDIDKVYADEGFSFPETLQEKVRSYKTGTVNFIAYYKNIPVGTVRLADPKIINRPYELYRVDVAGEHYEIQSLLVRKDYRDGSQFVMLGLFKAMYAYSVSHNISSWSSCGARNVYLTMRRLCKKIEIEQVDFKSIDNPLTQYLYQNNIIDTYFTMEVASFEPWNILRKFVKQLVKKLDIPEFLKIKKPVYEYLNYGGK
jgi:hypothetical protein